MYSVELTIVDKGAVLSVIQSKHSKYLDALNTARQQAKAYAQRYDLNYRAIAGGFFLVSDSAGCTVAQTAVRF